ncbi:MAG: extracellular solute-binding protein [Angelakisella sp.]|nr:extracellular solute-binding protein [Angelakisella sp.]
MKRVLTSLLAVSMILMLAACGSNSTAPVSSAPSVASSDAASSSTEVIEIYYPTYRVGANVLAATEKTMIDSFNEHFAGKYKLIVEELPSDVSYQEKMAVLAATGDLPDLVEGKGLVMSLAIKNGQAQDLTPFIEADPEYRAEVGEAALASNTIDGKIYGVPDLNQCFGYFYNKEMFDKAGIKPAETWDEWMENCEKLKASGVTPLTFFTGENSWTTQNVLVSIIGTQNEAGNQLVNSKEKIKDWNTPEVIKGLGMIQTMFQKYCSSDAVGGVYANVANYFLQEKAAIMPNGAWMIPDFSNPEKATEGLADKIGVAMFPGGGMIANYDYGFMMCTKDPAKQEAVWEAIKWFTNADAQRIKLEQGGNIPIGPKVEITEAYRQENPLTGQLVDLTANAKWTYKTMNKLAYENLTYDGFSTLYPELIYNRITPDDMVLKMNEISMKNE